MLKRRREHMLATILAIVLAALAYSVAAADPARGRALAAKNCASCHAIGPTGASRHKQAPPFREIARKYNPDDLGEAFAEGIVVGHKDMPEFRLNAVEIGDLTDYLKRLAARR